VILHNYHIHSRYCDGEGEIRSYIEEAIRQGLTSIGFSSHAPLPFPTNWAMPLESLPQYWAEINELKASYRSQIEVYAGLELDFVPGLADFQQQHILNLPFDYLIGSVHFVGGEHDNSLWTVDGPSSAFDRGLRTCYGGDIEQLVREYYVRIRSMVRAGGIDIVGHLDRILYNNLDERHFSEAAPWYRQAIEETLQTIAKQHTIVELNMRGCYAPLCSPNPGLWILKRCRELGIRLTIGTDAHRPEYVARGLERAAQLLHRAGYTAIWQLASGKWIPQCL